MNGTITLLKPPGITSQDAVGKVRRLLGVRKVGHAGTLDPGACGVLVVCVGRATKLVPYLMGSPKEYIAELTTGVSTDTLDSYGRVMDSSGVQPTREDITRVLPGFVGQLMQQAPAYSAVKVGGKPLYSYARAGIEMERPLRKIEVSSLALLPGPERGPFRFRIRCSKGTYIRVLLTDLAKQTGACGYVSFLERTASGDRVISDAWTFDEIKESLQRGLPFLTAPEDSVSFPRVSLPPYLYAILLSGAVIDLGRVRNLQVPLDGPCRIFCRNEFFGVGERTKDKLRLVARIRTQPA